VGRRITAKCISAYRSSIFGKIENLGVHAKRLLVEQLCLIFTGMTDLQAWLEALEN